MTDKYHIPQYLDEPMKFFLLTVGELVVFSLPFLIGLLALDQTLIGLITGVGSVIGIKRLKGDQGPYFLYQWLYWHLPPMVRFKVLPPSYLRELIG